MLWMRRLHCKNFILNYGNIYSSTFALFNTGQQNLEKIPACMHNIIYEEHSIYSNGILTIGFINELLVSVFDKEACGYFHNGKVVSWWVYSFCANSFILPSIVFLNRYISFHTNKFFDSKGWRDRFVFKLNVTLPYTLYILYLGSYIYEKKFNHSAGGSLQENMLHLIACIINNFKSLGINLTKHFLIIYYFQ